MPNGRRRQSNTAHANRQRNLQRNVAVVDSIPVSVAPVVVEAIELSESRSGEVKKLKGQIIGLKKKISNMEKQMEKLSGLKEQNRDLSETLRSSINKIREGREAWEDLREEMVKSNKFLAHVSNELLGTKHDVNAPLTELNDNLKGTDYDKLVEFIKSTHRLLSYMNIVMKKSREQKGKDTYFCDGDDMYVMKYLGKTDDIGLQSVRVEVPTTGDNEKDYDVTTERDDVAKDMVEKILKKKKLKESALKNYSW